MPIRPASVNISASPRSGPVPNQSPMASAPEPSVMNGITMVSAIGPIRNAVTGRGGVLHELGEAEHAALPLERDRPLEHGLLGRLDHGDQREPHEHPDRQRHDRRAQRERGAHRPVHEVARG